MQRMIRFSQLAARQLDKVTPTVRVVIEEKLDVLAMNPPALTNMIKRLQGSGLLRLRV